MKENIQKLQGQQPGAQNKENSNINAHDTHSTQIQKSQVRKIISWQVREGQGAGLQYEVLTSVHFQANWLRM
jgi:hypothetical protein